MRVLRKLSHSIEAQLKIEHQLSEQERRDIDLATCFPQGKIMMGGILTEIRYTIDPAVVRCHVIQNGRRTGTLYINLLRKKCTPVDCLTEVQKA